MKDIRKVYSVSYKLMLYFINGNASELCKNKNPAAYTTGFFAR